MKKHGAWIFAGALIVLAAWRFLLLFDLDYLGQPLTPIIGLDFMPVYACSHAVEQGLNPNNPTVIAEILKNQGISNLSSHNAYPATAGLLWMPFNDIPFNHLTWSLRAWLVWVLLGSAVLLALSPRSRSPAMSLAAVGLVVATWSSLWVTRLSLDLGQTNLLLVAAFSIGTWGLARGVGIPAGLAITLGTALKLLPVVLLPLALLLRRWKLLLASGLSAVLILVGTHHFTPQWTISGYLELTSRLLEVGRFGTIDGTPQWPLVGVKGFLFSHRATLLALGSILPLVAVFRHPHDRDLTTAACGLVLAGFGASGAISYKNYEAALLLPAIGLLVAWPTTREGTRPLAWVGSLGCVGLLWWGGMHQRVPEEDPFVWMPVALFVWFVSLLRFGLEVHEVRNSVGRRRA